VCLVSIPAFAQFHNEAAIDELAQTIVRQVGEQYACGLRVLWVFSKGPQQEYIVRVRPDGRECEAALTRATELGRDFSIRFSTLKDIVDDSNSANASTRVSARPHRNSNHTPASPITFDLIDDRIEP